MIRFLLDTNTLTHPLTKRPDPLVMQTLEQHAGEVGTSAVCVFEALSGIGFNRPNRAPHYLEELQLAGFPMLNYDAAVAALHSALVARLRRRGITSDFRDGAIAATARLYELIVVTDNERHFEPFGVEVVNWLR